MNLASNTAPVPSTMPSMVAAIQRLTGWKTCRCTSVTTWPVLRSYQCRLRCSVTTPSWTIRLRGQVLGLDLAALFPPEPEQGGLVVAHDDPGVRAADEGAAVWGISGVMNS